jgi:predicted secreted protein
MKSTIEFIFLAVIFCFQTKQNKTIYTNPENTFDITLNCAAGEGFSWKLSDSLFKDHIKFLKQDFKTIPDSRPGSDGIQIFHFEALSKGTVNIHFIYLQPFVKQPGKKTLKRTFKIIVK